LNVLIDEKEEKID